MGKEDTIERYIKEETSKVFSNARSKIGVSYFDVADAVGINRNTFYCYEKGTRTMTLGVYQKLCDYYNLDRNKTYELILSNAMDRIKKLNG